MKFTLSWLKAHLDTDASVQQVVEAMTMAGLEVEHVEDPAAKLAAFTVAKIIEAAPHPNAERLQVCQVDTADGRKEIVCGAPNARAGLTTIYAPIGAYVPGLDVTLSEKPVRGVVSNGMLCSASELELAEDSEGILDLPETLAVGTPAADAFGLEAVIDFEVTPNRPDWLGVAGIARDLAAAGIGKLKDKMVTPQPGKFKCPIRIEVDGEACPIFAGRMIRGVKNGPSPEWLQNTLRSIGLRPINALVDVTNFISYDRGRPLHVYDAAKLSGDVIRARRGRFAAESGAAEGGAAHTDEQLIALDGKTYDIGPQMSVIADAGGERPIGLGGVMGGASTGCTEATTDVFIESAWFDPIVTAQTVRDTGINSDAGYRFARGVDPDFVVPGLELATKLILQICGGEASEITVGGELLVQRRAIELPAGYVRALTGLEVSDARTKAILTDLGFEFENGKYVVPSWRADVEGKADLVEEVARIAGFDALPSTPLPNAEPSVGGVLTPRQTRVRIARRSLAAAGYAEAVTWSFMQRDAARLFGGGDDALVLSNPISSDLDCMRPSILPNLIAAAQRNANRGRADAALFEIGPVFESDEPAGQKTVIAAVLAPHAPRRWNGAAPDPLFALKGDLMNLLAELGAPTASLQVVQGEASPWHHPGRSARLKLGPKVTIAQFGELHPGVLSSLDADGPLYGFEIQLDAVPEPRARTKSRNALELAPLMPLSRDFAFLVDEKTPAGELVRAVAGADKALIEGVAIFDVYAGKGVPEGQKSLALEVTIQPREATLTDAQLEALSARIVAAAEQKVGAKLRG
jgi:phenylalanyl-tRNA synthetase beta chain